MRMSCNDTCTRKITVLLLSLFSTLAVMQTGCGKSADDLYTEGKALILNEETFGTGVESLLKFEKKFPEDPRTPEIILALGTTYQSRKNFNEAEKIYQRLIKKYPDSAEAYKGLFLLGYMYYDNIEDHDKATNIFTTFVETYPDSELTISAKIIVENIDIPIEEWSTIRNLDLSSDK